MRCYYTWSYYRIGSAVSWIPLIYIMFQSHSKINFLWNFTVDVRILRVEIHNYNSLCLNFQKQTGNWFLKIRYMFISCGWVLQISPSSLITKQKLLQPLWSHTLFYSRFFWSIAKTFNAHQLIFLLRTFKFKIEVSYLKLLTNPLPKFRDEWQNLPLR